MKFKDKSYRIGEIASFYGISLDAARLYDRKGIISPDKDKDNNYRYYSREDLVTMDYVFKMRRMEFSLDDIKKILNENSLLDMGDIVEAREKEIVERIEELEKKLRLIKDYRYKLDYCVKNLDRIDIVDALILFALIYTTVCTKPWSALINCHLRQFLFLRCFRRKILKLFLRKIVH